MVFAAFMARLPPATRFRVEHRTLREDLKGGEHGTFPGQPTSLPSAGRRSAMGLGERVVLNCERGRSETLFAEPFNAASNAAFLLAALVVLLRCCAGRRRFFSLATSILTPWPQSRQGQSSRVQHPSLTVGVKHLAGPAWGAEASSCHHSACGDSVPSTPDYTRAWCERPDWPTRLGKLNGAFTSF